jgi:transcriptional regulator with XRE-family HTH domain
VKPLSERLDMGRRAQRIRDLGCTWIEVARELGCSRAYAVYIARFAAEAAWEHRAKAKAERRAQARALQEAGLTMEQIAEQIGASRSTVWRLLRGGEVAK